MFFCSFFFKCSHFVGSVCVLSRRTRSKNRRRRRKSKSNKKIQIMCVHMNMKKKMILKYEKIAINWYLNALSFENI